MRVKIGERVYDSEEQPIMLIFNDDKQRKKVAENLTNMEEKDGVRKYVEYNDNSTKPSEISDWMNKI